MDTCFRGQYGRVLIFLTVATQLLGCSDMPFTSAPVETPAPDSMFVVLGEDGVPMARVLTSATTCPKIALDGVEELMLVRAKSQTLPLRSTISGPADSKPSAFPLLVCDKYIPPQTAAITVDGRPLPLPPPEVNRIVVIGDTGCRVKKGAAVQPCNDPQHYPFATIATAAAKWKPDLVIHVGDYVYRENACPDGNAGCAGNPWGYGWDVWNADFFSPAKPLLQAAPWIVVRGNHESCNRAGQGWWRMLDPRVLLPGRDCLVDANDDNGDYSDPYAVPIGGNAQIIVLDTSNTSAAPIKQGDIRAIKYAATYRKFDLLSKNAAYNIGVDHHPLLGFFANEDASGKIALLPGNLGLQSVFGRIDPLLIPPGVDVMLSGHTHVWEQLSFSSQHPTQFIAGFSGTSEDIVPLPKTLPANAVPAPGAIVDHFSSWVNGFGYMTMERTAGNHWDVKVWNTSGQQVNSCHIDEKKSVCDVAQVQTP